MLDSLTQVGLHKIPIQAVMAAFSTVITSYFWLIKSRKERPDLKVYQLGSFRATARRGDPEKGTKRLGIMQIDPGGVLVANNSIRQNSVIRFDCFLDHGGREIKGDWGWAHEDKPPWNIAPETTISISPACFFDVPGDYEVPDDLRFRIDFVTVSGKRFRHTFSLDAPAL